MYSLTNIFIAYHYTSEVADSSIQKQIRHQIRSAAHKNSPDIPASNTTAKRVTSCRNNVTVCTLLLAGNVYLFCFKIIIIFFRTVQT